MRQLHEATVNGVLTEENLNPDVGEFVHLIQDFYLKLLSPDLAYGKTWPALCRVCGYDENGIKLAAHLLLEQGGLHRKQLFDKGRPFVDITLFKITEKPDQTGVTVQTLKPPDQNGEQILQRRFRHALYSTWEFYRNGRSLGYFSYLDEEGQPIQYRFKYYELFHYFMKILYAADSEGYRLAIPFLVAQYLGTTAKNAIYEIRNALNGELEKNKKFLYLIDSKVTEDAFQMFIDDYKWNNRRVKPVLNAEPKFLRELTLADSATFDVLYSDFYFTESDKKVEKYTAEAKYLNACAVINAIGAKLYYHGDSIMKDINRHTLAEPMTRSQIEVILPKYDIQAASKLGNLFSEKNPQNRRALIYQFPQYIVDAAFDWTEYRKQNDEKCKYDPYQILISWFDEWAIKNDRTDIPFMDGWLKWWRSPLKSEK